MKYEIIVSSRFKKDLKAAIKRGYDLSLLQNVVDKLAAGRPLDENIGIIFLPVTMRAKENAT